MSFSNRMAWIIIGLTVVAVGVVHVRRQESTLLFSIQRLQSRHAAMRREIWDRHVEIGRLTTPELIRHRAAVMALDMTYDEPRLSSASEPENSDEHQHRGSAKNAEKKIKHSATTGPLW